MGKKITDERWDTRPADSLRGKAGTSLRRARRLRADLRGLDWEGMDAADRDGLRAALTELGGDIPLVWLIGGQEVADEGTAVTEGTANTRRTTKAAPAASPSHLESESSDGEAAFLGHPAPTGDGGPMRPTSVVPPAAPGNGRCMDAAHASGDAG